MKLYISLDMEGLAGTFNWEHEKSDRQAVKKCMIAQIEWVLQAIRESPHNDMVSEIVIADSHNSGDSLPYDITAADDRVHLISGSPRGRYMMPDLFSGADLVFLLGYHAGSGRGKASMDHTYSARSFLRITINGTIVNEALINAAYAGHFDIPVGLVTGDSALSEELSENGHLQWVEFVETKRALSRFAARLRPMGVVKAETIAAVQRVLAKDPTEIPRFYFTAPYRMEVKLTSTAKADLVEMLPRVKRMAGRTVDLVTDDYYELFDAIMAMALMASMAS